MIPTRKDDEQGLARVISANVRRLRATLGWSQDRLVAEAGISNGYLSQIEAGDFKRPGLEVMLRLAGALGVDVYALSEWPRPEASGPQGSPKPLSDPSVQVVRGMFVIALKDGLSAGRAYRRGDRGWVSGVDRDGFRVTLEDGTALGHVFPSSWGRMPEVKEGGTDG